MKLLRQPWEQCNTRHNLKTHVYTTGGNPNIMTHSHPKHCM